MQITKVTIRKETHNMGKTLGKADIVFDDQLFIRGIKIKNGVNGMYLSMPADLTPDKEYKSIVFPITRELREHMENKVLEAYQNAGD